jgi:hypothetical protein
MELHVQAQSQSFCTDVLALHVCSAHHYCSEFLLSYHAKHLRLDSSSAAVTSNGVTLDDITTAATTTADTAAADAVVAADDACSSATTAASTARYFEEQLHFVQELVDIAERLRFVEPVTSRGDHLKVLSYTDTVPSLLVLL